MNTQVYIRSEVQAAFETSKFFVAGADDPKGDFWAVREELRMYNPGYCDKPYLVALNKMDLPDASDLLDEIQSDIRHIAAELKASSHKDLTFQGPMTVDIAKLKLNCILMSIFPSIFQF